MHGRPLIRHHKMAMLLACVALLLRIAVPAGFMPMASGGGALMPCPAAAPMATTMAMAGHAHGEAGHGEHDRDPGHACPFGAFAALADLAEDLPAAAPVPSATTMLAPPLARTIAPGLGLAAPPPPKTGPPLLS